MNRLFYIAAVISSLLCVSCTEDDADAYYTPEYWESYAGPFMPIMDDEAVSLYGNINGADNVAIIASGKAFEFYGIPAKPILDNIVNGEILFEDETMKLLKDRVAYMHEVYDETIISQHRDSLGIEIQAHDLKLRIKQGDVVHDVVVCFPPTEGTMKIVSSNYLYYWKYSFTLKAERLLIDGEVSAITTPINYEVNIYYNRFKDSGNRQQ